MISDEHLPAVPNQEQMLLGVAMKSDEALHTVRPLLVKEDFSLEVHRRIWERICTQYDAGLPTDAITVYTECEKRNDGIGLGALLDLQTGVPMGAPVEHYASEIKDRAILRQVITACSHIVNRCMSRQDSAKEILEAVAGLTVNLAPRDPGRGLQSASELVQSVGIQTLMAPRKDQGLMTPWPFVNRWTCGFCPGELWVLAAHTSVGKTSAAVQLGVHAAQRSKGVAIFSREVPNESLFKKACYQLAQVDSEKLRNGEPLTFDERDRLNEAVATVSESPIYFDATSAVVTAIHAAVRKRMVRDKIDLIIIDYLQILGRATKAENKTQEVGENAWACKQIATEFKIPVLLLSQFSRESNKPGQRRRPELSDLKNSGDIENHSNGVWFIHRESDEDAEQVTVEFIIAKQRDGKRNIGAEMWFLPRYQRFEEKERA